MENEGKKEKRSWLSAEEERLKHARDLKNSFDTAKEEGRKKTIVDVTLKMIAEGMDNAIISAVTELSQ